MDKRAFDRLISKDPGLGRYIICQARRYFPRREDFENISQEAWIEIFKQPKGLDPPQYRRAAYRLIFRLYQRERRNKL